MIPLEGRQTLQLFFFFFRRSYMLSDLTLMPKKATEQVTLEHICSSQYDFTDSESCLTSLIAIQDERGGRRQLQESHRFLYPL